MNKQTKIIGAALGLALVMGSTVAVAESQYGYASSGVGPVTAQANVKLKVTVPLLILLIVHWIAGMFLLCGPEVWKR